MPGDALNFLYTLSRLTLTQLCETGTIRIPIPQTRKLRDVYGGFSRPQSQPVVSDPRICPQKHYAMLLPVAPTQPHPPSDPLPIKSRSPGGALCSGHIFFDHGLLEPLSEPSAVEVSIWTPPSTSQVPTPGWAMQARALRRGPGGLTGFHRTLFPLVTSMGFPDSAGVLGSDVAGVPMAVGETRFLQPPLL